MEPKARKELRDYLNQTTDEGKAESGLMNLLSVLDLDLPSANRTQANFWKLKCLEYIKELSNANKGLRRLSKQNKRFRDAIRNL